MFYNCQSLTSFPDISKWNINNIEFSLSISNNISSFSKENSSYSYSNISDSNEVKSEKDIYFNNIGNFSSTMDESNNESYDNFYD